MKHNHDVFNSLCYRALQRKLSSNIVNLPTLLSCQQGNGLQWTYSALEQLSRRLNETFNKCREEAVTADEVWQEARRHAIGAGQAHDEQYSGIKRRLRGSGAAASKMRRKAGRPQFR